MLAHDLLLYRKKQAEFGDIKGRCYGDSLVVEPLYEISLIFGRSLLNFLGIRLKNDRTGITKGNLEAKEKLGNHGDDINIQDLFPEKELCPLDHEIIEDNKEALIELLYWANKSVAHLTTKISLNTSEEQDLIPSARKAIYKLILDVLPEINMEKIWWHEQVEKLNQD